MLLFSPAVIGRSLFVQITLSPTCDAAADTNCTAPSDKQTQPWCLRGCLDWRSERESVPPPPNSVSSLSIRWGRPANVISSLEILGTRLHNYSICNVVLLSATLLCPNLNVVPHIEGKTNSMACGADWRPVVALCTARFNMHKFYVLPTPCIYVFCVDLRTNSGYFPIQH
jgi:hypothetical protein